MLAKQAADHLAHQLMRALALLQPTIEDLVGWPGWAAPPSSRLLATVRRNSPLAARVATLPSLT